MSLNKNNYLQQVLESYKMKHVSDLMENYIEKREIVKDALAEKFKDQIVTRAINSGSYAKHDAINTKFDLDICQPFKRNAFDTLEEMADAVFDFFNEEFEDDDLVAYATRKQRVSTGITFFIDGDEIQMDIVPGRELSAEDYLDTHRLNLYVRPKLLEPASTTQTNIQKHIDLVKGKSSEREIIRLLKVWKSNKNKKRVKSFFVELITIKAFEKCSDVPSDIWEKLEMVLEYIRDNIQTIRLEDPANSNNVVSNTMTDSEKEDLQRDIKQMLEMIESSGDNLKSYFPVNDEFFEEDEEERTDAALDIARSGIIQKPWCHF
ncbi:nucleotidyltransferase [Muricauda sp. 334s03]|uniref:Nucleotidyltransferase n=1 Tax=Flagellimonas yonaguniensis TaxID=3031325 RepID=A0ABT5XXZ7_9FLAO|nr:nucleotidyltransferase [[Muricauda] yonaguniensis]MDF0716059.1 nucleotidyltransferase [[Muricauda] yonaguniensis]